MTQHEVAYLGRMTAGLTHEMKNVLATIKETAGLISDLLPFYSTQPVVLREKFEHTLVPRILEQVRRGVEISTRLNRLAHTMDHSPTEIEVDDLLDEVLFLMSRFARLKQVALTLSPKTGNWSVLTHPLRLELVLAAAVDYCLEQARAGQRIAIAPASKEKRILFQVLGPDEAGPAADCKIGPRPEGLESLADLLPELGVEVGVMEAGVGIGVQFPV